MIALKAPFPWFGGKSRIASLVWQRFGGVANYVEPFAGSLAVLLGRPHPPGIETVNDKDAYLANFWRAIRWQPEEVASWADWPVSEADLLARHRWLVSTGAQRLAALRSDPDFCDPKVAGWWVWGLCSWIGSGWCANGDVAQLPHLGSAGMGINAERGRDLAGYFRTLSDRLRRVRVCCGEWHRVLGESVTIKHGVTGVMLDPPYAVDRSDCYSVESDCSGAVREWAIANGHHTDLRIALCGYDGEHSMPGDWECVAWKARGGYGSQSDGQGRENSNKERIWFSPNCLKYHEDLFAIT